ncbi:hypothetical protein [Defluviimonas salinarum]|uniref:DUF2336 domain-containing protein n=1 Tax=Defluviimonas salinarum TaxID=2992147 RepID=A0ABT3J515_9RHOB|nr:hypothetical protein [Defluviimonas salinarum]MCW3782499.1 hypothetical protein [Defluviimonas salinarum]
MISVAGRPFFGGESPRASLSPGSISNLPAEAANRARRMILALGHARAEGMADLLVDPFSTAPTPLRLLRERVAETDATEAAYPADITDMGRSGRAEVVLRGIGMDVLTEFCATLLRLEMLMLLEARTLSNFMIASGIHEAAADRLAPVTVAAAAMQLLDVDTPAWVRHLATFSRRELAGLGAAAEAGRTLQADALARFGRIRDIDDLEAAADEVRAREHALRRLIKTPGRPYPSGREG